MILRPVVVSRLCLSLKRMPDLEVRRNHVARQELKIKPIDLKIRPFSCIPAPDTPK